MYKKMKTINGDKVKALVGNNATKADNIITKATLVESIGTLVPSGTFLQIGKGVNFNSMYRNHSDTGIVFDPSKADFKNFTKVSSIQTNEEIEVYVGHRIMHSEKFKYQLPATMKSWGDIEVLIRGFDADGFGRKVKSLSRTLFDAGFLKFTATFGSDVTGNVIELATYVFSVVRYNDTEIELKLDKTGYARLDDGVYQERSGHVNYSIEGIVFRGKKKDI